MENFKIVAAAMAAMALGATASSAAPWSQPDIDAALTTMDKSHIRECAAGAGGKFEQHVDQRDINGDGRNELIVHTRVDGASGCVGWVGQEIDLLISDGKDGWQRSFGFDAHSLNFLDRADSTWPDVEITGPGSCFPIWRHDQGEYGIWKTCEAGKLVFAEGRVEGAVPAHQAGGLEPTAQAIAVSTKVSGTPSRTAIESRPVEVVNIDRLDGGMPYLHNGSTMMVYPDQGLIVYAMPRSGISVKRGTVLFRGQPWSTDNIENAIIRGQAFTFRKGCEAAGYNVRGLYHHTYTIFEFTLEGAAPVRKKGSCDIVGHDIKSSNATLKFDAAWD